MTMFRRLHPGPLLYGVCTFAAFLARMVDDALADFGDDEDYGSYGGGD